MTGGGGFGANIFVIRRSHREWLSLKLSFYDYQYFKNTDQISFEKHPKAIFSLCYHFCIYVHPLSTKPVAGVLDNLIVS
jgi:hypothetical protein